MDKEQLAIMRLQDAARLDVRKAKGLPCNWQTGMGVFRWWMEDDNIEGQIGIEELLGDLKNNI